MRGVEYNMICIYAQGCQNIIKDMLNNISKCILQEKVLDELTERIDLSSGLVIGTMQLVQRPCLNSLQYRKEEQALIYIMPFG